MSYLTEFPDFDMPAECERLIALGWEDASWHKDMCPNFTKGPVQIFIDWSFEEMAIQWGAPQDFRIGVREIDADGCNIDDGAEFATLDEGLAYADAIFRKHK